MPATPDLPSSARIVVIGGGLGGTSVAYHLAQLGETDVVLLERAELTSGSTFHSAGLVGQLRADPALTRMNMYSVELYRKLQQGDHPPGWTESGSIKLASSAQRLDEIRRQISWAAGFGLPLVEISPREAHDLFPLLDTTGVVGGAYLHTDGSIDPSQLCQSLAAGARAGGVRIYPHTRVTAIDVNSCNGFRRVRRVCTDAGDIDCEIVVDCAGMFAAEIARMVDVRVPIVPMSHQYLITGAIMERPPQPLPSLRDPDLLVYFRQELDGLLMGGYERNPQPWTASATRYDDVPADFNGRLLPPDWDRLEEITENAQLRVPAMAQAPIRTLVNGPEAFTPDNEFCLGETEVAGFFVAAGFCAHGVAGAGGIGQVMAEWIVSGDPGRDVWRMNIRRFQEHYRSPGYTLARTVETYQRYYDVAYPDREHTAGRPLRRSAGYPWHVEHGAVFGEKAGWERVNYYDSNATRNEPDDETAAPLGWAGREWSAAIGVEHRATRSHAGLFDQSSFAKISISGADAATFLERLCDNTVARGIGEVTYTQLLNQRGGIEADVTVTRLREDSFVLVTGTAHGSHNLAWLRDHAARDWFSGRTPHLVLDDVTGRSSCFALWGPRAPEILRSLTPADLSDEAFPFMTAQHLTVAEVPVRAQRVTFVGELGWELYCDTDYGLTLWQRLWEAGRAHGLVAAGYRAIDTLRLEKGYRVWGSDITAETTPYEAGLGFCVKLGKPGGFVGEQALRTAKAGGITRRLTRLHLRSPRHVVLGGEPIVADGEVVGRVTSGGFGYSIKASIAYGYLPVALITAGRRIEINMFGELIRADLADSASR